MASTGSGAVEWLRTKGILVGILVVLAAAVGFYLLNSGDDEPEAQTAPAPVATATLAPEETTDPAPAPSPAETGAPSDGTEETAAADPAGGVETPSEEPANDGVEGTVEGMPEGTVIGNHDQAPELQKWYPVAEDFAAAWANRDGGHDAWLKRIQPLVTKDLYEGFKRTDFTNVMDDELDRIIATEELGWAHDFEAVYADAGTVFLARAVAQPDGSWLISEITSP